MPSTNLISYPFRLGVSGNVVVRADDSDNYYAEELAVLTLTVPGERPLVPEYGLEDPTFGDFLQEELTAKVDMFGPPVTIQGVNTRFPRDGVLEVTVAFDSQETSFSYFDDDDDVLTDEEDQGV